MTQCFTCFHCEIRPVSVELFPERRHGPAARAMGVSGGNWDDDEEVGRNAPTVTYGLEPPLTLFVKDAG